jgi:hypothetical protein
MAPPTSFQRDNKNKNKNGRFLLLFLVFLSMFLCFQNISWATLNKQSSQYQYHQPYDSQQQQQQQQDDVDQPKQTQRVIMRWLEKNSTQHDLYGGGGRSDTAGVGVSRTSLLLSQKCSADHIVKESYTKVYKPFVDRCTRDKIYKKECFVNPVVSNNHTNNYNNNYSPPPPWWFETLLRNATTPKNHPFLRTYHEVWFDTPNLCMCRIEKVSSDRWRKVAERFRGGETDTERGTRRAGNGWTKETDGFPHAVFFRDPLERFLSGYIDKCLKNKYEGHCKPDSTSDLIDGFSKPQGLNSYLSTFPLSWNVHFVPQALYCDGLFRRIQDYEFVGSMADDRFKNDLLRLIRNYSPASHGHDPSSSSSWERYIRNEFRFLDEETNSTDFRASLLRRKVDHATHASGSVLEYYDADSVRMALQYYSIDYVTLNLTIPKWVQDILDQDCQNR